MVRIQKPAYLFTFIIVVAGFLVGATIMAQAQTDIADIPEGPTEEQIRAGGIAFPVPELGNCGSKEACRAYCNDPQNIPVCISFAEQHGLMNKDESSRAKNYAEKLRAGNGPGGCASPKECEAYCSDLQNIEACVVFAESQGFKDPRIEEAKKIRNYLQGGNKMPGGCASRESCERYCGDFSHAEECFAFAKNAGIAQGGGVSDSGGEGPKPEQLQKILELAKRGEMPGGCTSKDACERYCRDPDHFEACTEFGVKAGFMTREQADRFKKTGGKGPGECRSEESCRAYCNDPTHQEECFKFAEEHGLIPAEEIKRAKEGLVQMRAGFDHAPPEVAACLKSVLGPSIIEDIQSGKIVPGPQIGERVRECFAKFGAHARPHETFADAPPEVVTCLKEKIGESFEKIRTGEMAPTPEMGDAFRICFQKAQLDRGGFPGGGAPKALGGGPSPQMLRDFLRSAPPGVAECLTAKFGGDLDKIESGQISLPPGFMEDIRACFDEFQPEFRSPHLGPDGGMMPPKDGMRPPPGDGRPREPMPGGGQPLGDIPAAPSRELLERLPPEIAECVKRMVGPEVFERMKAGEASSEDIGQKIRACYGEVQKREPSTEPVPPQSHPGPQSSPTPQTGGGEYQKQYEEEYRRQYEEQYKQQYREQQPSSYPQQPGSYPQQQPGSYPEQHPAGPYPGEPQPPPASGIILFPLRPILEFLLR